jgi:hypothetical protein
MLKRKGQIVPHHLIPTQRRRHGHLVTFGCDVEISEGVITPLSKLEPAVILVAGRFWNRRNRVKEPVTATWPGTTTIRVP